MTLGECFGIRYTATQVNYFEMVGVTALGSYVGRSLVECADGTFIRSSTLYLIDPLDVLPLDVAKALDAEIRLTAAGGIVQPEIRCAAFPGYIGTTVPKALVRL